MNMSHEHGTYAQLKYPKVPLGIDLHMLFHNCPTIDSGAVSRAALDLLSAIQTVVLYAISCGIPFYNHARMSWQLGVPPSPERPDSNNWDVERAAASLTGRHVRNWRALRIVSGVIFISIGIPAFPSYYMSWPLEGKWPVMFLMLSVVFSVISFTCSTVLIAMFTDWTEGINELRDRIQSRSILFSIPAMGMAWSTGSLLVAGTILGVERIGPGNTIDYQAAVPIMAIIMGIGLTLVFYTANHFRYL
ncbi:hypothetical protein AX15_006153 [Amanita polypyramis BW_CC]|nr:hypothetical protein AX15_006153 [Amanita polypyramis BW_CC]